MNVTIKGVTGASLSMAGRQASLSLGAPGAVGSFSPVRPSFLPAGRAWRSGLFVCEAPDDAAAASEPSRRTAALSSEEDPLVLATVPATARPSPVRSAAVCATQRARHKTHQALCSLPRFASRSPTCAWRRAAFSWAPQPQVRAGAGLRSPPLRPPRRHPRVPMPCRQGGQGALPAQVAARRRPVCSRPRQRWSGHRRPRLRGPCPLARCDGAPCRAAAPGADRRGLAHGAGLHHLQSAGRRRRRAMCASLLVSRRARANGPV
jgi:hypothetical protein